MSIIEGDLSALRLEIAHVSQLLHVESGAFVNTPLADVCDVLTERAMVALQGVKSRLAAGEEPVIRLAAAASLLDSTASWCIKTRARLIEAGLGGAL